MPVKILNFGSLNVDYTYQMEHFVRPGETASSLSLELFPGGKGLNQSVALANAGAEVYHAGAIGKDGEFLLELLQSKGVDTRFIERLSGRSGHAIIQVDQEGQNCIILYGGANQEITREQIDCTLEHFSAGDYLMLQNEITENAYLIEKAYEKGMFIALNPSPSNEKIATLPLDKVGLFILNEVEGSDLTGEIDPEKIITGLIRMYPACKIVLTLGKRGAMAYDGREIFSHGIYRTPVVDTTAAGDTFTGFFLAEIAAGESFPRALGTASKASALAIGKKGASVSIPTRDMVNQADLTLE